MNLKNKIINLKKEKNALILAHFYQPSEIQEIADLVGDSYFLSKQALESDSDLIIFCGVKFMAESAKILSPQKKILIPNITATCPMADMGNIDTLKALKKDNPKAKIVTYINSNIDIKANSDVCVTSSSAKEILSNIDENDIIFIPDRNLGSYLQEECPDKNFILYPGFCPTHEIIKRDEILKLKAKYPTFKVLAHPECTKEIRDEADFIGSTSEIIDYSISYPCNGFIVLTEEGVLYQMKLKSPNKSFISPETKMICPNMKVITLESLYNCLLNETFEIKLDENIRLKALKSLQNMHTLSSK